MTSMDQPWKHSPKGTKRQIAYLDYLAGELGLGSAEDILAKVHHVRGERAYALDRSSMDLAIKWALGTLVEKEKAEDPWEVKRRARREAVRVKVRGNSPPIS